DAPEGFEKRLAALPGVARVARAGAAQGALGYRLSGAVDEETLARVAAEASGAGARLLGLRVEEPSLEDAFVALTGESAAEEAPEE
ncbi:MAG TPA: ABC transporter ATP-binding protein, partial [Candidatus Thermoplasmatota archaeon]|nr:ABC transporter ATP-binding protein [Candidatus Thermoplasmatota archaeon]